MGFPKAYASTLLSNVFKSGNKIALLTAVDTTADTYTEASGKGYARYTITTNDFSTSGGVTTTAQHILYGLAEESWGTITGIAVFGNSLLYLAELEEPKAVGKDTVPVFKKYNAENGEGIKVTLDVVSSATASVTETT